MYCMLYAKNMIYCILKQVWIKIDVKLERNRSTMAQSYVWPLWDNEDMNKQEWNRMTKCRVGITSGATKNALFVCLCMATLFTKQMLEHPTCQSQLQHFELWTNLPISTCLPGSMLINKATETKNWLPLFSSKAWQNASSQDGQHEIREAISIQLRITCVSSAEVVSGASYFYKRARLIIWPSGLLMRLWAELQGDDVVDKPGCSHQVQIYCFILVQCHSRVQGIWSVQSGPNFSGGTRWCSSCCWIGTAFAIGQQHTHNTEYEYIMPHSATINRH